MNELKKFRVLKYKKERKPFSFQRKYSYTGTQYEIKNKFKRTDWCLKLKYLTFQELNSSFGMSVATALEPERTVRVTQKGLTLVVVNRLHGLLGYDVVSHAMAMTNTNRELVSFTMYKKSTSTSQSSHGHSHRHDHSHGQSHGPHSAHGGSHKGHTHGNVVNLWRQFALLHFSCILGALIVRVVPTCQEYIMFGDNEVITSLSWFFKFLWQTWVTYLRTALKVDLMPTRLWTL